MRGWKIVVIIWRDMEDQHPIRIVARRTGLSAHVIRIGEKRYRAVVPGRTGTNRRYYSSDDIEKLMLLRRAHIPRRSIRHVTHLPVNALRDLVKEDEAAGPVPLRAVTNQKGTEFGILVESCIAALEHLSPEAFHAELLHASMSLSQPAFLEKFLVQLMERVGECWRDGSMRIMHEHLASSILRTVLGSLGNRFDPDPRAPYLIVTTPPGQLHEMGALIAASTAASEGWHVIYLGPSLPAEEIAAAARQNRATAVALSILYPADDSRLNQEL